MCRIRESTYFGVYSLNIFNRSSRRNEYSIRNIELFLNIRLAMFVGTTGSLKNPKRDALCNAFEIGYCQFFNLKKIIPWNKRHPKPVFYQQAKVRKKKGRKKNIQNLFQDLQTISRSNKVTVGPRSSYKFISCRSSFNTWPLPNKGASRGLAGFRQRRWRGCANQLRSRKTRGKRIRRGEDDWWRVGIGREARAPALGRLVANQGRAISAWRGNCSPQPEAEAAGGGRIRRALAAGVGPRVVFDVRLPGIRAGFKTKPLGFQDDNLRESLRKMVREGSR